MPVNPTDMDPRAVRMDPALALALTFGMIRGKDRKASRPAKKGARQRRYERAQARVVRGRRAEAVA